MLVLVVGFREAYPGVGEQWLLRAARAAAQSLHFAAVFRVVLVAIAAFTVLLLHIIQVDVLVAASLMVLSVKL